LCFTVHPVISSPSQLVGAPKGTEVKLECNVEAFPKSINYWVRESGKYSFNDFNSVDMYYYYFSITRNTVMSFYVEHIVHHKTIMLYGMLFGTEKQIASREPA